MIYFILVIFNYLIIFAKTQAALAAATARPVAVTTGPGPGPGPGPGLRLGPGLASSASVGSFSTTAIHYQFGGLCLCTHFKHASVGFFIKIMRSRRRRMMSSRRRSRRRRSSRAKRLGVISNTTTTVAATKRFTFTLVLVAQRFHRLAELTTVLLHVRFASCDPRSVCHFMMKSF